MPFVQGIGMKWTRYVQLETTSSKLTPEEISAGWHFSYDWDFMLIHPKMEDESSCCGCNLCTEYHRKKKGNK